MKSLYSQFADWAQTKSGPYDYGNGCNCALAQFLRHQGLPIRQVGGFTWYDHAWNTHAIPRPVYQALVASPNTFEALALRLKEAGL